MTTPGITARQIADSHKWDHAAHPVNGADNSDFCQAKQGWFPALWRSA